MAIHKDPLNGRIALEAWNTTGSVDSAVRLFWDKAGIRYARMTVWFATVKYIINNVEESRKYLLKNGTNDWVKNDDTFWPWLIKVAHTALHNANLYNFLKHTYENPVTRRYIGESDIDFIHNWKASSRMVVHEKRQHSKISVP